MPVTQPIVIGAEFVFVSMSNGDSTLTVWVTVTNGTPADPGRFTVRWDNGAATPASLVLNPAGQTPIPVTLDPGPGTFNAGTRRWADWRTVQVSSAPRPGG